MNLLGTYEWNSSEGSDIWGWADPNGNEYALVGLNDGFSVVDVTNPTNPVEMFYIADLNSTWRDIKTWGNYAYVTTEADAGLLIVDLSDMTGNTYSHVTQFTNPNGSSVEFTAAHNIYIDENGVAYIFGASSNTGSSPANGAIFLDVASNATNPIYLGEWNDHYIHDGMTRGDTMYAGCIYAGELYIVDVSNKNNPQTLGSKATPSNFTHNAWVSDNGKYVFTTDERSDAYIGAYDITNVNNIQEVDRIQSNPGSNSIPHNTHVDGNFIITSWYRDGTTIHDITYPNNMIEVAYYDSYSGSGNGFDGCWGTYPFLPSGNIISSDINSSSTGNGRLLVYGREFKQACHVQGNIYDCITGQPINQANIQIINTNINIQSNLLGFFQTAVIDSGLYQIVISANGYISDTLNTILNNGIMHIITDSLCQPLPCNNTNITSNINICDGSNYTVGNSIYNSPGTYIDTLTSVNGGCDSIITTILNLLTPTITNINRSICNGQNIIIGNNNYSTPGLYSDLLLSSNGCDSTVNLNLTVEPVYSINNKIDICFGDSTRVGGNTYFNSGIYIDTLSTIFGCDSIITTSLTVSTITAQLTQSGNSLIATMNSGFPSYSIDFFGPNGFIFTTNNINSILNINSNYISDNGIYYLIATDINGCVSDTSSFIVDFILNTNEKFKTFYKNINIDFLGRKNSNFYFIKNKGLIEKRLIVE